VAITSIQWLSLAHNLSLSTRIAEAGSYVKAGWFLPMEHLLQIIAPDFFGNPATLNYWGVWNYGELVGYVGVASLALVLIAVLWNRKQSFFWLVSLGVTGVCILPTPIARLIYEWQLPLLSTLQPTRLLMVVCFSLAVLASLGADTILQFKLRWRDMIISILIWFGMLAIPWLILLLNKAGYINLIPSESISITSRNLVLPTIIWVVALPSILLLRLKRFSKLAGVILLAVITMDLLRFAWKFTPFTERNLFFPVTPTITFLQQQPGPFRFMTNDDRLLPANVSSYYGIESVAGYDPLSTRRYEQFIAAMERGKPDISDPLGFNRIVTPKRFESPLAPHLSASYLLSLIDIPGREPVFQEGQTRVYTIDNALPRIYLVNRVTTVNDRQSAMNRLYEPSFQPGKEAVVEGSIPEQLTPGVIGEIKNLKLDLTQISLEVVCDGAMYLVINNQFDPWWRATINGKVAQILPTNFAFQGVYLPAGRHTINLSYGLHR
jgi:hypothetical protein